MPKLKIKRPTKKQRAKSDLISLILSYALNSEDMAFFIYDLNAEMRSYYLIRDGLKLELILGPRTKLEQQLLKHPKKEVLSVLKDLISKFPYVKQKD